MAAAAGLLLPLPAALVPWAAGVVPLVVAYPLCKRFTDWPQAVLGLCMNWGLLMGAVAIGARGVDGTGTGGTSAAPTVWDALLDVGHGGLDVFVQAAGSVDT